MNQTKEKASAHFATPARASKTQLKSIINVLQYIAMA